MTEAPKTMAEAIERLGGHDRTKCVRCLCLARKGPHPVGPCCPPPTSAPWVLAAREDGTHTATGSVTGNGALD
jgi:hypothetical protein